MTARWLWKYFSMKKNIFCLILFWNDLALLLWVFLQPYSNHLRSVLFNSKLRFLELRIGWPIISSIQWDERNLKRDMLYLSLMSLEHKALLSFSLRFLPHILPLPLLDKLPHCRFWLAQGALSCSVCVIRRRGSGVSISDTCGGALTFVHLGIQMCMHADSHTHRFIFLLFSPKHSTVMILNLNNWNGVISLLSSPK